jgi:hypothetical protein
MYLVFPQQYSTVPGFPSIFFSYIAFTFNYISLNIYFIFGVKKIAFKNCIASKTNSCYDLSYFIVKELRTPTPYSMIMLISLSSR